MAVVVRFYHGGTVEKRLNWEREGGEGRLFFILAAIKYSLSEMDWEERKRGGGLESRRRASKTPLNIGIKHEVTKVPQPKMV